MAKTVVLTGASDGIGAAAAEQLARRGHQLVLVGRSPEKTAQVAERVAARAWFSADYEKLEEVRALARDIRRVCPRIDVLANNAGGLFSGPHRTQDGFERTFQVNHLAGFLLTRELLDVLLRSRAAVVNTSSIGAKLFGHIDITDLNDWRRYRPNKAYGDSKLANILFTKGLCQRYGQDGLTSVAFHPGNVATRFASATTSYFHWIYQTPLKVFLISPEKGASNLVYFIEGTPGRDWQSGQFYGSHRRIAKTNPQADDADLIQAHWEASASFLELS
ncbi:MAG: SDR family NAD(P)-dependent oxidoreductase [Propionibacteriaceae bacterium]|jgi:NAD(P)-dependent dehydrogenase (short-subunit alcohol dehydrogenase family)|nr:SDR family NAD(P)-dependent oxidoreductase [Propionibacteriaceae bacterium]